MWLPFHIVSRSITHVVALPCLFALSLRSLFGEICLSSVEYCIPIGNHIPDFGTTEHASTLRVSKATVSQLVTAAIQVQVQVSVSQVNQQLVLFGVQRALTHSDKPHGSMAPPVKPAKDKQLPAQSSPYPPSLLPPKFF